MVLTRQQEQDLAPVLYEWNMLVAAEDRLKSAMESDDVVLTNLVLEAFVVHFRQLGNFFFGNPEEGDVHVGQFVGGRSWKSVTGRKNRWQDLLVRASKQVAHLTAERHFKPQDRQKQLWPVSQLVREVGEELQVFCALTGFGGFPHVVASTGFVTANTAGSSSAAIFCNSVAINRTVNRDS